MGPQAEPSGNRRAKPVGSNREAGSDDPAPLGPAHQCTGDGSVLDKRGLESGLLEQRSPLAPCALHQVLIEHPPCDREPGRTRRGRARTSEKPMEPGAM